MLDLYLRNILHLAIQLDQQTKNTMENLITKNQEALSLVETKHLQKRYEFVNDQLILDQFRRHLDSTKRNEYQEDWFDIQMILQQRKNLTK